MIDSLIKKNREIIRQMARDIRASVESVDDSIYNDALNHYERKDDHALLRQKMADRFAITVEQVKAADGTVEYERYVRGKQKAMIDFGAYETITSGIYQQLVGARASLFNSRTQSWDWVELDEEDDEKKKKKTNDDRAELIRAHRKAGSFRQNITDADKVACAIDSGPLFVPWKGGHNCYEAFSPRCMHFIWPDSILDDGQLRGVSQRDIEDAFGVIIQLSSNSTSTTNDIDNQTYIGIFARSVKYPLGRYVTYRAKMWNQVPEIGDDDTAIEWTWDGSEEAHIDKVANPLSYLAAKQDNALGVEYPIIVIKGGITIAGMSDTPTPLTSSMYEDSLEIDLAISRLVKDALNAARGKDVLTDENGNPLPRSFEAIVHLSKGQTLEVMGVSASNAKDALEVIKGAARSMSGGYSVPGHLVISEPGGGPEAGIAIALRMAPLIADRDHRISLNVGQMDRLYAIEQGNLAIHADPPIPLSEGTEQVWNPGRYLIPQSAKEKTENIALALKEKFISYVRAVRDWYDLPDRAAAIKMIKQMDEDNIDYPAPTAGPTSALSAVGLTPRPPREQEPIVPKPVVVPPK